MNKSRLIFKASGLLLLLAINGYVLAGIFEDMSISILLSIHSLLLVVGGSVGVILLSYERRTCGDFLKYLTFRGHQLGPGQRQELIQLLASARRAGYAWSAIALILGLIVVLMHLQTPSHIGPGIALFLHALLYAVVLGEIILTPMSCTLARPAKIEKPEAAAAPETMIELEEMLTP